MTCARPIRRATKNFFPPPRGIWPTKSSTSKRSCAPFFSRKPINAAVRRCRGTRRRPDAPHCQRRHAQSKADGERERDRQAARGQGPARQNRRGSLPEFLIAFPNGRGEEKDS